MDRKQLAIQKHLEWKVKIEIMPRVPIHNREEQSVAYMPGVAEPCIEIAKDESLV